MNPLRSLAGVDHLADRVVPEILLVEGPRRGCVFARIGEHAVIRMAAADARRLHAARRGKVSRSKAHAVHARRRGCDRFDVIDAFRRFQNGVDEDRLLDAVLGFELREELIEVMDIPRAFDLRQHDDVELVADGRDDLGHVVEHPRRVQAVDARPDAGRAKIVVAQHLDESLAGVLFLIERDGVFEVAEHHVDLRREILDLRPDLLVVRRNEVDHPLEIDGERAEWLGRADGERGEVLSGRACRGHRQRSCSSSGKIWPHHWASWRPCQLGTLYVWGGLGAGFCRSLMGSGQANARFIEIAAC